jgi:hypothetical protein
MKKSNRPCEHLFFHGNQEQREEQCQRGIPRVLSPVAEKEGDNQPSGNGPCFVLIIFP